MIAGVDRRAAVVYFERGHDEMAEIIGEACRYAEWHPSLTWADRFDPFGAGAGKFAHVFIEQSVPNFSSIANFHLAFTRDITVVDRHGQPIELGFPYSPPADPIVDKARENWPPPLRPYTHLHDPQRPRRKPAESYAPNPSPVVTLHCMVDVPDIDPLAEPESDDIRIWIGPLGIMSAEQRWQQRLEALHMR